ncbi:MAG TPA: DUF4147 domain-containing protein [Nevskiales bacterium]|nr:DUF4147 domain-containing protein [Nevskiales bacterium]
MSDYREYGFCGLLETPARDAAVAVPPWLPALRARALAILRAGLASADPRRTVERALHMQAGRLAIGLDIGAPCAEVRSEPWTRVHLVAFGKAAVAMAEAAQRSIPAQLLAEAGVVVTNRENVAGLAGFKVVGAGHPLPDAAGQAGARLIAERVRAAGAGELVLVLISGGGSALLPSPAGRLALADKIATTERLLASGADIGQVNTVRKHLSALKGGGLARLAAPAALHALILSDVLGDEVSAIASGPTVPDPTTYADAIQVLERYDLWGRLPSAVRVHLSRGLRGELPETPKPGDPLFARTGYTLIGGNRQSLAAAAAEAGRDGRRVSVYSTALTGEARVAAERLAQAARDALQRCSGRPFALLAGGETTVTLRGRGLGGRNQEFALAFALAAEQLGLPKRWVLLSAGTDGRDGPTDAAGGLVDPWSLERIRGSGAEPNALLADNDAYRALLRSEDLLRTGPTGTNVADLQVLLVGG